MKYVLLLLITLPVLSFAQTGYLLPIDQESGKVIYRDTRDVSNKKEMLFKNAQSWITKSFGDYKSVIQFEDKDAGKLVIKGWAGVEHVLYSRIQFRVTIDVKDNKYRCVIEDIKQADKMSDDITMDVSNVMAQAMARKRDSLITEIKTVEKEKAKRDLEIQLKRANAWVSLNTQINDIMAGLLASLEKQMKIDDDF